MLFLILPVRGPWHVFSGAMRNDLLQLEWDRAIDFDGTEVAPEGRLWADVAPHLVD